MSDILNKNKALKKLLDAHLDNLCAREGLERSVILNAISDGTMVLLGNPCHKNVEPILVGQPAGIKVNANIGTSPLCNSPEMEMKKLNAAVKAGADTVMDLSIAGDLDAIRRDMLAGTSVPLGTVPMYAAGEKLLDANREISSLHPDELFDEIEKQAKQGVDFMTVHCGISYRGARMGADKTRVMGIVSRGGSMLARWMLENEQGKSAASTALTDFLTYSSRIQRHAFPWRRHSVPEQVLTLATPPRWEEVINLGQSAAKRALEQRRAVHDRRSRTRGSQRRKSTDPVHQNA